MIRNLYLSSCGIFENFALSLVVNAIFCRKLLYFCFTFYIDDSSSGLALETSRFEKACSICYLAQLFIHIGFPLFSDYGILSKLTIKLWRMKCGNGCHDCWSYKVIKFAFEHSL